MRWWIANRGARQPTGGGLREVLFYPTVLVALLSACAPAAPTLMPTARPVVIEETNAVQVLAELPTRGALATKGPAPSPVATSTKLPTPTRYPTRSPYPTRTPSATPSITATPSDTPTPWVTAQPLATALTTPDLSLPIAPSRGSKLGLHVVSNNSPRIMEFVRQAHPAVIKAVGDLGWLAEVKMISPETVTIGRVNAVTQDLGFGDPLEAAHELVRVQLPQYLLNRSVDFWEGWNEPDPDQDMHWYATFEAERVRLLASYGLRASVGGFSTGVPEYNQFYAFLPAVEAARRHGGVLSLHEYGAPTLDYLYGSSLPGRPAYANRGALAFRYRWWYQDVLIPRGTLIPLVISEAGIDGIVMSGVRPGPAGLGWKDFVGYWEGLGLGEGPQAFINQLAWYDLGVRQDHYVIGFAVFTAGGGEAWRSYDVNDILPQLGDYVRGTR